MKQILCSLVMIGLCLSLSACGGAEPLVGPAGPTGATGATGAKGAQGETGNDGTPGASVASGFSCSKTSGGYSYRYAGVSYSNGDAWVTCSAAGGSFQTSVSQVYKATQVGATTFTCLLGWDVDASTSGYWNFSGTGGIRKTVYNDVGSGSDQTTVTYAAGDCTTY